MSSFIFFQFLLGIILIGLGANLLVNYTERLSSKLNISHFISSFIFIGLATSSPEIFVTILTTINNESNIAVGNALGSNIANIAFVFALSLLFVKINQNNTNLILSKEIISFSTLLFLYIIILIPILWDSKIYVYESLILIAILIIFIGFNTKYLNKQEKKYIKANNDNVYFLLLLLIASLGILLTGTEFFLISAREFASYIGVSNYVIGLSITAIGSSLPELAASIESIRKKNMDFIMGNILGSNIFNIVIVMGLIGIIEGFLNTSSSELLERKDVIRDIVMISVTTVALILVAKNYNSYFVKSMSIILLTSFVIYQINLYRFNV